MLVLTRKVGETLVIGDDVTITVTFVENGKVSLGINAPPTIRVDRSEVHERREKAAASGVAELNTSHRRETPIKRTHLL